MNSLTSPGARHIVCTQTFFSAKHQHWIHAQHARHDYCGVTPIYGLKLLRKCEIQAYIIYDWICAKTGELIDDLTRATKEPIH